MSDPLDLAGVIGTWVAVFLALVALLGLLPAYLLYKRSRSDNAAALAAIDDPRHKFVSGTRIFGVVLTQKFNIPDLRREPPLSTLESATLANIPSERVSGRTKPKTGWVEFAQLVTAVFPKFEFGGRSLLSFKNGETRLPVHKTWLLALGIIHRFSLRLDHGLPLGAAVEAAVDGGLIQGARHSGLSGYLDYRKPEVQFPVSRPEADDHVISFEMHNLSKIRDSLARDHFSFASLALLFRGRVSRGQGTLLNGRIASQRSISRPRRREVSLVILSVQEKLFHENFLEVLPGVNVPAKKEVSLKMDSIPDEIWEHLSSAESLESTLHRHGYYKLGYWFLSVRELEVWILKKDAYYFVLGYFELEPSPYGFLFDVTHDIVVRRILRTKNVETILSLASLWWLRLPKEVLTDELRSKIHQSLQKVSHDDLLANQWSRRVMQAIVSLDKSLVEITQHDSMTTDDKIIMWKSIRAMYACDEDFQKSLGQYLNGLHPDDGRDCQAGISFDIGGGTINVPGVNGAKFLFDFNHLVPEIMTRQEPPGGIISITPAIAIFACLQGQLRATAWKMSLSPAYLETLDQEIGDICYISTNTFHLPLAGTSESWSGRGRADSWQTQYVDPSAQSRRSSSYESRQLTLSHSESSSLSLSFSTAHSGNRRPRQGEEGQSEEEQGEEGQESTTA